jgi:hypothetical protein
MTKQAIVLTFAESVENHVGNQQIGTQSTTGWSCEHLDNIKNKLENDGIIVESINLNKFNKGKGEEATVLVIRDGVEQLFGENMKELFDNLARLEWDKKYWDTRRKKVLNKIARHNLCFAGVSQEPDYKNGKGRVYTFEDAYLVNMRKHIEELMEDKLFAEGNYYYDMNKKCGGIGMHGDTERRKVFGVNLGTIERYLVFQWYLKSESVGDRCEIKLKNGDCYIMSEKAVGYDWKSRSKLTLRHGAGLQDSKFIQKKVSVDKSIVHDCERNIHNKTSRAVKASYKLQRGKSPYIFFCVENRSKVKEELGDYASSPKVISALVTKWNILNNSKKASDKQQLKKYEAAAQADKEKESHDAERSDEEPR